MRDGWGSMGREMARFREALQSGRVMLMDGAMGTELQRASLQPGECGEFWNVTEPERVRAVHQAYVDAGAQCLLTNTFQANPTALAKYGKSEHLEAINRSGLELARLVAGPNRFVLADICPIEVLGERGRVSAPSTQGAHPTPPAPPLIQEDLSCRTAHATSL